MAPVGRGDWLSCSVLTLGIASNVVCLGLAVFLSPWWFLAALVWPFLMTLPASRVSLVERVPDEVLKRLCPQCGHLLKVAGESCTNCGTDRVNWHETPRLRWRALGRAYYPHLLKSILKYVAGWSVFVVVAAVGAGRSLWSPLVLRLWLYAVVFAIALRTMLEVFGQEVRLNRTQGTLTVAGRPWRLVDGVPITGEPAGAGAVRIECEVTDALSNSTHKRRRLVLGAPAAVAARILADEEPAKTIASGET